MLLGVVLACSLIGATWQQGVHRLLSPADATAIPANHAILNDADSAPAKATPRTTPAPPPPPHVVATSAPITQPSYLVLIVLDGARTDYFNVPNLPHIQALRKSGTWYNNAMAGILESETPSGHATISTGSLPRDDGILSFGWANSDKSTVSLFSESMVRQGGMERIMSAAGAPTIASLVHKENPSAKVVALSGYKYYAADALGGPNADVTMYYATRRDGRFGPTAIPGHVPPASVLNDPSVIVRSRTMGFTNENRLAMTLAAHTFNTLHQQVTLINLPDSDWPLGHPWGASRDPKDVKTLMQNFDTQLGDLEDTYRKAGVLDKTMFVITADHGFAPTYHKVPKAVIAGAVQRAGTSILRDTYHTGSYVWIKDSTRAATIAADITRQKNPYIQSVYYRTEGPNGSGYQRATSSDRFKAAGMENANQYLLQTFNGETGPDIVVFFTEDAAGVAGSQSSWKADHGGADWEAQHVPLLMAGPGVRRHHTSNWPARLEDVAPTALTLLGMPTTGMDGSVLADALRAPTIQERDTQANLAKTLRPVIESLQTESTWEAKK